MVTIIPARGGSKGLPGKNLRSFCGKPLLAWSILQAQGPVYVSSDSDEILRIAKDYGAAGIKRPGSLSTDTSSSESALAHVLEHVGPVDKVIFLQSTSPLRTAEDTKRALDLFDHSGADSLFSCTVAEDLCLWRVTGNGMESVSYDAANRGNRQSRAPLYLENGSIYIFKPEVLKTYGNRLGGAMERYIMEPWQQYEIDDEESFDLCRYQFIKHKLDA